MKKKYVNKRAIRTNYDVIKHNVKISIGICLGRICEIRIGLNENICREKPNKININN